MFTSIQINLGDIIERNYLSGKKRLVKREKIFSIYEIFKANISTNIFVLFLFK
jgi:hypothetical protein